MVKKEKTIKYWPEDYPGFKIVKAWKKKYSPRIRIWATDDPEGWFIDVLHVAKKSKEVKTEEGWIIEKDLEGWSSWYKNLGWEEIQDLTEI